MITWHTKTSIRKLPPRDYVALASLTNNSVAVGMDAKAYYAVYYSKLGTYGKLKLMQYSRDLKPLGLAPIHLFTNQSPCQ